MNLSFCQMMLFTMSEMFFFFLCFVVCYEFQVKRDIDLVYGGGSVGLMGLISQKMYNGGCNVLGYG